MPTECLTDRTAVHYCGKTGKRHCTVTQVIHDFERPIILRVSKYYCRRCNVHFTHPGRRATAPDSVSWTNRVIHTAIALRRKGWTLDAVAAELSSRVSSRLAPTTVHEWQWRLDDKYESRLDDAIIAENITFRKELKYGA